ncbi:dihydrolipoyl dehydrogenase [[Clostridium] symbiosum]|uniref:dihydrolipoyl dehydrogenase n=1 Tax=Clostridium symbiosum TaxID=1512 RepID=UPI001D069932|nr:dihydrolipoyl dehydrogenase [[Clostridium] symbiosum]MCB6608638.1 dihydrolipoyl dehydrogenase [[Clostridium] symbiosum]MCB6931670.1 dihydrolipoyl dehydrogenase [[Clostridium] symbiosum]
MAEEIITSSSLSAYEYEITVIGAGPGGYETAIRAAQMGKKTCIIESTYLGGTCLNVGCIPTKTLIKSTGVLSEVREAATFGVEGVEPEKVTLNLKKMQQRKTRIVKTLSGGVKGLLRGNGISIVEGKASFVDAHTVAVGDRTVTSEYFIIATGSNVFIPPFIEQEGNNHIITSKEALEIEETPVSVAVIGGGVIGMEFAFFLNKLGSKITVLELMDRILPMVDPEVSELARERLAKSGVDFRLGCRVKKIRDNTVYYEMDGKEDSVKADMILMAVGRIPNTDGLNAEAVGLEFERKAVKTDGRMHSNIPNIYAIGDVNGKVMLAHTASHEGMIAVSDICGVHTDEMNYERIPSCVYLDPEIACIGLTEPQAREKYGDNIKVGRFNLAANGKSLVEGDTDGIFKVITDSETGEILGVHLYGKHVTDMIGEISAAMTAEATVEELIHTVHPHPTVSEALGEAFMAAWNGRAVNCL